MSSRRSNAARSLLAERYAQLATQETLLTAALTHKEKLTRALVDLTCALEDLAGAGLPYREAIRILDIDPSIVKLLRHKPTKGESNTPAREDTSTLSTPLVEGESHTEHPGSHAGIVDEEHSVNSPWM